MLPIYTLLLTLPVLAAATTSTITVPGPTVATTYIQTPTTAPSSQYTDPLTERTSLLNSTNFYRWQHNATFLTWNSSLASYASSYAAKCQWEHSHSIQGYGENLAMGYDTVTSAVDAWGNERDLYTFDPPEGFSEDTGHFTQLVWKETSSVGCASYQCDGKGGVSGYLVVCEYWPTGNVVGTGRVGKDVFFGHNVQSQVHMGSDGFNYEAAIAGVNDTGAGTGSGTSSHGVSIHVQMGFGGIFMLGALHLLL